jgi:hypothetical protein
VIFHIVDGLPVEKVVLVAECVPRLKVLNNKGPEIGDPPEIDLIDQE